MWWPAVAVISGSWVGLSSLTPDVQYLFIYLSISFLILLFLLLWYVHGNTYRRFRYGVHVYFAGLPALFLLGALNASIVSVPSVATYHANSGVASGTSAGPGPGSSAGLDYSDLPNGEYVKLCVKVTD